MLDKYDWRNERLKCPNCGAEIPNDNKFCQYCGTQISVDMLKEREKFNKSCCPKCGSSNITFNREKQSEIKQNKNKNRR